MLISVIKTILLLVQFSSARTENKTHFYSVSRVILKCLFYLYFFSTPIKEKNPSTFLDLSAPKKFGGSGITETDQGIRNQGELGG